MTDAQTEFGSSEYAKEILGTVWGYPPTLDLKQEAALQKALIEMIDAGWIESAHDCSEGGIAVTLAESSLPQSIGVKVEIASQRLPAEFALFGEDASRVVLSCDRAHVEGIQQVARKHGISAEVIGETVAGPVEISLDGKVVVSATVAELREVYEGALEAVLKTDPELVAAD